MCFCFEQETGECPYNLRQLAEGEIAFLNFVVFACILRLTFLFGWDIMIIQKHKEEQP